MSLMHYKIGMGEPDGILGLQTSHIFRGSKDLKFINILEQLSSLWKKWRMSECPLFSPHQRVKGKERCWGPPKIADVIESILKCAFLEAATERSATRVSA